MDMDFHHLQEIYQTNMGKKLIDNATKTGYLSCKNCLEKIVNETTEATGELVGNKITDKFNLS